MSVLQPSVVECTWSELRSLAYGHLLRPIHDGEVEGKGKEKEKGEESGQVVEGREEERQLEGRVLQSNGHWLLQAHRGMVCKLIIMLQMTLIVAMMTVTVTSLYLSSIRSFSSLHLGKLLSVKGTLLHVNFAANRSSNTRDSSSKRIWNRGGGDRHRHDTDYVEKSVIGGEDQSESDMRSKYTSKIITKIPVTEIGTVEYNTECCFCDKSTYGVDKCKNEYVHRCGNCVERAQAIGEIDGEVKNKDIGAGLHEVVLREGEGADDGVERENDDTFMQALVLVTRLSDDEFKGTSDNQRTARTKSKSTGQHTLKKQKRDNAGECAVSIRYKEARFIIGPAR